MSSGQKGGGGRSGEEREGGRRKRRRAAGSTHFMVQITQVSKGSVFISGVGMGVGGGGSDQQCMVSFFPR